MRPVFGLILGMAAVAGCQNLPPPELIQPKPPVQPVRLNQPLDAWVGHVISVHSRLRFAVLDYSLSGRPQVGDRLEVWRADGVVGELKITGPFRNTTVVADVVSGEPQPGDQTRPKRLKPAAPTSGPDSPARTP